MSNSDERLEMLWGSDGRPGLVGCAEDATGMTLWWRRDGQVEAQHVDYRPMFLCSHAELLDQATPSPDIEELSGENYYCCRVRSDSWEDQKEVLKHVSALYRQDKINYEHEPYIKFTDPVNMFLMDTGLTHFTDMTLDDVRTVYFGLRAYPSAGADYADPNVLDDRIVMVMLADSATGETELLQHDDEKKLLQLTLERLKEIDPDVIVGHDLFKLSFNYFFLRCKKHRIKLDLGRDGSIVKVRKSRAPAAEKQLEYPRADVVGRHLVDSWFLTVFYDIVKRELEEFDAASVANYLDRQNQLPPLAESWDHAALWDNDRSALEADLRNELAATQSIFRTLVPSYFAQSQMLPFSLQDSAVRGNGVKINNLIMREYLRLGESIPEPSDAMTFPGGFTDMRESGLIANVLNVDIASLYPSIMLTEEIAPYSDTVGVFQPLLRELTRQRLEAKRLARESGDEKVRVLADARQAAFKVFINSFFGYLGTNRMHWADPTSAEHITATGQEIVQKLATLVEEEGGHVIEIDTDGIYFRFDRGAISDEEGEALVARFNSKLKEGIVVEYGGCYPAMLSVKIKNYALLDSNGNIQIKGSALKSRGLEPFLHRFIENAITELLKGDPAGIERRYEELKQEISERRIDIRELAKTDTIIESLDVYRGKIAAGKRNKAAAYEVALQSTRDLIPGDKVRYYITGEKATVKAFEEARPIRQYDPQNPDYNIKYYLKKLEQNLKKVKEYVPDNQAGLFG
ncbi:hypothetical protein KDL29_14905 [bacterium]|nr:hypothetical protein [bacterium]